MEIQELNLSELVILAGAQSNVTDYYNASDCFVLSSAWEGFGIVLAEAMACELPCITTDAGGCREVVDNENWIIPTKNSDILSQKMQEMLNLSETDRQKLGKQNRQKSLRFDIEKTCDQWENIYTMK